MTQSASCRYKLLLSALLLRLTYKNTTSPPRRTAAMDTVDTSVKAMEKMCEEAHRLWGPRAEAPVDGVVWNVSNPRLLIPARNHTDPRQVISSDWAFLVADDDEDLHQFVYHLIDKSENTIIVDVCMETGMILYVSTDSHSGDEQDRQIEAGSKKAKQRN